MAHIKQSERKAIYQSYAKHLIELGKAYPCFCSPEELDQIRKKQEAAKIRPGYYGVWAQCRNVTVEEAIAKIKNGEKYILRFKSNGREDRKIQHHDMIKGKVDFPENDQDIVNNQGGWLAKHIILRMVVDGSPNAYNTCYSLATNGYLQCLCIYSYFMRWASSHQNMRISRQS